MKAAGQLIITDPGTDRPLLEVATLQCVHCGQHFEAKPLKPAASLNITTEEAVIRSARGARIRGFCQNCNGPVCGPGCAVCVHVEQMLENIEQGRPLDYKPIIVPVRFSGGEQ